MSDPTVRSTTSSGRPRAEQRKRDLSPGRQRLVELMQQIQFGRIHDLPVRGGEPVFEPPPRAVKTVKIAGRNAPRPRRQPPILSSSRNGSSCSSTSIPSAMPAFARSPLQTGCP